jgi:hypothetical protein
MGNAKFCYFNLITQDETEIDLSSGGEDAFYPLTNLMHPHALKTYRSSGSVTAVIVLDFQTAATFDSFLAVGSSIGTLDLTAVTIEANATNVWTSPAFSTTVTDFDYAANFASKFFTAQTYRYVRLTLTGTADFVEVGKLFLGSAATLTSNNVSIGFKTVTRDLSTVDVGRYGQRFIDEITDQRQFTGSIGLMTTTEQATIQAMYDYCGTTRPVWFVLDPDELILANKDVLSGYFYFTERPGFTNDFFGLYSTQFTLDEAK